MKKVLNKMSVILTILACVVLGVFGQLSMKKGMNNVGFVSITDLFGMKFFEIIFEKYVLMGIVLYMIGSVLWLVVLSQAELSYAYPLISLGYVFTAILAKVLFNESLTFFRMFGIILIVSGVFFIMR